jgi:hypothetical protein
MGASTNHAVGHIARSFWFAQVVDQGGYQLQPLDLLVIGPFCVKRTASG